MTGTTRPSSPHQTEVLMMQPETTNREPETMSLCFVLNVAAPCNQETRFVESVGPDKTRCRPRLCRS
jgi:hypothetical protein